MVLPFTNLSGDSSMNQLAEAVTDGLTDAASRFGVQVIAGDTAKAYAGKPIEVKQIGKDLGLRYLVRGSLQPTETRVRVSAQLIDGRAAFSSGQKLSMRTAPTPCKWRRRLSRGSSTR